MEHKITIPTRLTTPLTGVTDIVAPPVTTGKPAATLERIDSAFPSQRLGQSLHSLGTAMIK